MNFVLQAMNAPGNEAIHTYSFVHELLTRYTVGMRIVHVGYDGVLVLCAVPARIPAVSGASCT